MTCPIALRETAGSYFCTREDGHEGPCAAVPVVPEGEGFWRRLAMYYLDVANAVRRDLENATRDNKALSRENERFRHGTTIEGDFVCPNDLAFALALEDLAEARKDLSTALRKNRELLRDLAVCDLALENVIKEKRELLALIEFLDSELAVAKDK